MEYPIPTIGRPADEYHPKSFPPENDGIFGNNRCCRIADVKDGTSNTLLVGETTGGGKDTYLGEIWVSANIYDTKGGNQRHPYGAGGRLSWHRRDWC